jgi:hypothetical protein
MPTRRAPNATSRSNSCSRSCAAGQVEVHAVLCRLRIGHRHEAHADGRVLICPDDDLAHTRGQNLLPEGLRPEPGQPGQVVSVHNDVMEPDRHAVSIRGHAGPHPREPGLLLPRSAHVTAGCKRRYRRSRLTASPARPDQFSCPPGDASPALRAGLTTGRHPLARRGKARAG